MLTGANTGVDMIKTRLFLMTFLWLPLLLASPVTPVHSAASVSTAHATVTLLSEQSPTTPGQTLWFGLHFELIPHWHLYWRNPGASGAAPVIRWTLPSGWTAGDIHWPTPQRIRVGPLTNYGYEETVTLLVPVRLPETPLPAGPLTLTADVEWLVCRVECVPETGRFTLEFHGSHDPHGRFDADAETVRLFKAARTQGPEATTLAGRYRLDGDALAIAVETRGLPLDDPRDVWFAAYEWGPVDASAAQSWQRNAGAFTLRAPIGDLPPTGNMSLEGLLVVESADAGMPERRGYPVRLSAEPTSMGNGTPDFLTALGFAILGGLILNIMPCVLPVLGIKVLGFVQDAGASRQRRIEHGLIYSAGILISFALLAVILMILRAGGDALGWGFQLQSPVVVTLLAYLMLLIGLSLSGVFTVGSGLMGAGHSLTGGHGLSKTFATGVLAVVVASPCTAPFMGAALGFALTRSVGEALAIFLALGLGFALPVALLSLWPAGVRLLPKPGPWMVRVQQCLAFLLYATVAWLLWVLSQQIDAQAYGAALAGLIGVALVAWLYGQWRPQGWRLGLLSVGLTAVLAFSLGPMAASDSPTLSSTVPNNQAWSETQVRELTAAGRPVFVNFTAAWCITCQVNEQVALATVNTQRLFASRSVAYLVADWTRRDPAITRQLERYGRSGVPLYLLYSPTAESPVVLPPVLTEGILADALQAL